MIGCVGCYGHTLAFDPCFACQVNIPIIIIRILQIISNFDIC